jgi:hypothetical protein
MKSGIGPHKPDHRSYDYLKTHVFGSVGVPALPPSVDNDAHLWIPNQDEPDPIFGNPALPYGCTDYSQTELVINFKKELFNPGLLEKITGANASGGYDMRKSFQAMIDTGVEDKSGNILPCPFKQYFEVVPQATLDWFDAIRVACFLGIAENKTVSVGMPWYSDFEQIGSDGILPPPKDLAHPSGWHDAVFVGYTTTNSSGALIRGGDMFLKIESHQGEGYGDKGFCYLDRPGCNTILSTPGVIALIGSPIFVANVLTVDLSWVQYVLSFVRMIKNNYIMRPLGLV